MANRLMTATEVAAGFADLWNKHCGKFEAEEQARLLNMFSRAMGGPGVKLIKQATTKDNGKEIKTTFRRRKAA